MLTGIMISEVGLPAFGIRLPERFAGRQGPSLSVDLSIFILALHTSLIWDWIVSILARYVFKPQVKDKWNWNRVRCRY